MSGPVRALSAIRAVQGRGACSQTQPAGIRPEWYFLWMFQALKYFPATIFGIEGALVVLAGLGAGAVLALLVPFWATSERAQSVARWAGVAALVVIALLTALALAGGEAAAP